MKKIKRTMLWFAMLTKRLLRKYSFLVILLCIPVLLPLANAAMQGESGVLKIALAYEGKENPGAQTVIKTLTEEESILLYIECKNPEEARELVETGRADGAWIFTKDFHKAVTSYAGRERVAPLVTALEREGTVPLQMAREKLYGAIYPQISHAVYNRFVTESFSEGTAAKRETYYENTAHGNDVIRTEKLYDAETVKETNYLTAPLRGLLSILVLLCGLAAAMYYLEDEREGRYDWLPPGKRLMPAAGTCLAGTLVASVAVFIALLCGGIFTSVIKEAAAMLVYGFAAAGFSLMVAMLFKDPGRFGAFIPLIIIGSLALSPIFFNIKEMPAVRHLLPVQYYLRAIHDSKYLAYMLCYTVATFGAAFGLIKIKNKQDLKITIKL